MEEIAAKEEEEANNKPKEKEVQGKKGKADEDVMTTNCYEYIYRYYNCFIDL